MREYDAVSYLQSIGIFHLVLITLSHPDLDHLGGRPAYYEQPCDVVVLAGVYGPAIDGEPQLPSYHLAFAIFGEILISRSIWRKIIATYPTSDITIAYLFDIKAKYNWHDIGNICIYYRDHGRFVKPAIHREKWQGSGMPGQILPLK